MYLNKSLRGMAFWHGRDKWECACGLEAVVEGVTIVKDLSWACVYVLKSRWKASMTAEWEASADQSWLARWTRSVRPWTALFGCGKKFRIILSVMGKPLVILLLNLSVLQFFKYTKIESIIYLPPSLNDYLNLKNLLFHISSLFILGYLKELIRGFWTE